MEERMKIFAKHLNRYGTDYTHLRKLEGFGELDGRALDGMYQEHLESLADCVRPSSLESSIKSLSQMFREGAETKTLCARVVLENGEAVNRRLSIDDYRLPFLLKDREYWLRQQLAYVDEMYENMLRAEVITPAFADAERTGVGAHEPTKASSADATVTANAGNLAGSQEAFLGGLMEEAQHSIAALAEAFREPGGSAVSVGQGKAAGLEDASGSSRAGGIHAATAASRVTTPGKAAAGKAAAGKTVPGKAAAGKTMPGKVATGKAAAGKTTPGKATPTKTTPGKTTPTKITPGKTTPKTSDFTPSSPVNTSQFSTQPGAMHTNNTTTASPEVLSVLSGMIATITPANKAGDRADICHTPDKPSQETGPSQDGVSHRKMNRTRDILPGSRLMINKKVKLNTEEDLVGGASGEMTATTNASNQTSGTIMVNSNVDLHADSTNLLAEDTGMLAEDAPAPITPTTAISTSSPTKSTAASSTAAPSEAETAQADSSMASLASYLSISRFLRKSG